jgi:hypothetical protein
LSTDSKGYNNGNENPSVETTKDFDVGSKVQAVSSGHEMTYSQVNANLFIEHEFVENVLSLEIPSIAILPTNSKVICRTCRIRLHISSLRLLI